MGALALAPPSWPPSWEYVLTEACLDGMGGESLFVRVWMQHFSPHMRARSLEAKARHGWHGMAWCGMVCLSLHGDEAGHTRMQW